MKKKSILMIGLWSLLVSTLGFSALTFAWLNYQKPFNSTQVVSGDLAFQNLTTTVYRYDYPIFSGSTIINYTGDGTVSANTLTTDAHSYAMNKFDPTFITLAHGGSVTQAYIGEINTNLVLKMSFDLVYSTPVDWSVSLVKNTAYAPYVDADGVQHYGISNYLNFVGLTSDVFSSLTTDKTLPNEIVYYKVKKPCPSGLFLDFHYFGDNPEFLRLLHQRAPGCRSDLFRDGLFQYRLRCRPFLAVLPGRYDRQGLRFGYGLFLCL